MQVQDFHLKSLEYDTGQIAVFWENLGHKHFVNMDCDTTLATHCDNTRKYCGNTHKY